MTDDEILILWQDLNNAFMRRGADRDTPVIVQFARALLSASIADTAGAKPPMDCGAFYAHDMDRRLAKLSTAPQSECAPREAQQDGWKLVPHEPTKEMLEAGREQWERIGYASDVWQAMYCVAPTPERAADYEALEREHMGDPDKKTGIFAARADADTAGALSEEDLADVRDAARILAYEDGEKGALGMRLTSLAHRLAAANKPVDDSRERFWCELCAIHDPDDLNKREVELAWSIWQARAALNPPASQERADAGKDAMDLAAGASEGQADTYDVRVAFEEIARAISEHEPPDRRVAVSMRALNRWHQALAKFLYATPPGAAAEIAALRERIAGMEKDAERWRIAREFEYVTDFEVLGIDQRIDAGFAKEPK